MNDQELASVLAQLRAIIIQRLRDDGWIVCPPNSVPLPRDLVEARKMKALADYMLKDQP